VTTYFGATPTTHDYDSPAMLRLVRLTILATGALWAVAFFVPLLISRIFCGPNLIYDACGSKYLHELLSWLGQHREGWLLAVCIYLACALSVFHRQFFDTWRTTSISLRILLLATIAVVVLLIASPEG
jgi:hypothetical protein